MLHFRLFCLLALSSLGLVWLGGCDKAAAKKDAPSAAKTAGGDQIPTKEQEEAAEIAKSFAMLSPEDRALAEEQKVCPVSGEKLGTMDKPIKVTVNGQTVFLCCSGCEEDIKKDPDKYLAKLKK